MRFVGIDLAWSPHNRSGAAVLSAEGRLLGLCTLGADDEVLRFVDLWLPAVPQNAPGLVAIDAPLAVPNSAGARPCDREVAATFRRFHAGPYPANRHNLGRYGGLRGEEIRTRLQAAGFHFNHRIAARQPTRQVIEVFPHPAIVSLFHLPRVLEYKSRPGRALAYRVSELARLRDNLSALADADPPLHLPPEVSAMDLKRLSGRALKEAEDRLDAVVCAYIALYAWTHGPPGYLAFGESGSNVAEIGQIVVPMTGWMWDQIGYEKPKN